MKENKGLEFILLFLKIALPIAMLIPVIFFSFELVDIRIFDLENAGNSGYHSGYAFYLFASSLILLIVNGVVFLFAGIGLLVACLYKSCPTRKKKIRCSIWLVAAPFLNQLLYFLIPYVIALVIPPA